MQQRQPRLGDILDDYCPRERRLTNHAVVAMIGHEIKQTRCTTCDTDHEYRHAKVPRQRRKPEPAALNAPAGSTPKRVVPELLSPPAADPQEQEPQELSEKVLSAEASVQGTPDAAIDDARGDPGGGSGDEGPVHRPLIRAQLPRIEGQPPASRPAPDFSIRQPAGRQNRFRPRHQHGGAAIQTPGGRQHGSGGANSRSGAPRQSGGTPPMMSRLAKRQGHGGKRFK